MTPEQFVALEILYDRLLNGHFYQDHDEDLLLMGILRQVLDDWRKKEAQE